MDNQYRVVNYILNPHPPHEEGKDANMALRSWDNVDYYKSL